MAKRKKGFASYLSAFSYLVKAVWIFFPGIIFLLAGLFLFLKLPQGQDIIYQSTDARYSWITGVYLVLAAVFWVFTSWYTARLIAYDRNDLYKKAPAILYHFPRLIGYSIFLVLWLGIFLIDDIDGDKKTLAWIFVFVDYLVYWIFHSYLERSLSKTISNARWKRLFITRNIVRVLIIAACTIIVIGWGHGNIFVLLFTLPVIQVGFLFLVIARFPMYENKPGRNFHASQPQHISGSNNFWDRYFQWSFKTAFMGFRIEFEKPFFIVYHLLAGVALLCYILSINWLGFARELTSFPLVLLCFGILLGIINLLALISRRSKININLLLFVVVIIGGWIAETHEVKLVSYNGPGKTAYDKRENFDTYLTNWINWHRDELDMDSTRSYPVFFTLADGGASRSGYWAAAVLSKLHEATRYDHSRADSYFMDHLFCLSGASGGSVGNGAFLSAYALQQKDPSLKTDSLVREYLGNDFLVYPLARILGPDIIKPAFSWLKFWDDRAGALEFAMEHPVQKDGGMSKMVQASFGEMIPTAENQFPILSINTTRVNDGSPGVISTINIESSRKIFGTRIDVLRLIPEKKDIRLSTAMVLGARFPYMSPGGKMGNDGYFVDGGYFDNSGAGVVHEMLLELNRLEKDTNTLFRKYLPRMQFYVIHLSNTPYPDTAKQKKNKIHPVLNDLATPLLTLAGSYNSQTNINDARLTNYLLELSRERKSYIIFNLYTPEKKENISMNWVISNKARDTMDIRLRERASLDSLIRNMKRGQGADLLRNLVIDQNKAK